jgi:hypothetical protein
MTDGQLRTALHVAADEVTLVDLGPRVRARARVVRRRRRAVAVALPVVAALVAAGILATPSVRDRAVPAGGDRTPVVDLANARPGGVIGAALAIVDTGNGTTWVATASGRVARLSTRVRSLPGAVPTLSAGGSVLSFGGPGTVTVVETADGSSNVRETADGQVHQVSVSPRGGRVAYATDDQVDSIDLVVMAPDSSGALIVPVTTSAATGALVPTVWSDDGTAVLVLEGAGATLVDDADQVSPVPRPGIHIADHLVLAHGWGAAPDLSQFAMSDEAPRAGRRRWVLLETVDGRTAETFSRPADDRLMGWTPDDRLVWWHRVDGGYTVVSTDTAGAAPRTELGVTSDQPDLEATWAEDAG